jgi:hypothetical protein
MVTTRQERERLVLDLYNQGRNTREIAEEARMSFSAIGAILKKAEKEKEAQGVQEQKLSLSSQAYKLFSERRTMAQVAIALNLREPEVTKFFIEYCKLTQLDSFCRIYDKIKDDIYPFLRLYTLSKVARMGAQQVVRLLTIANDDLPSVEYRYEKLKREVASLEGDKRNSAMILQELSDEISYLRNTLEQHESACKELRLELDNLNREYRALKELVNDFQDNNEEYIKFTKSVEEKVLAVLPNAKVLLRNALLSITESITNNSERFRLIFHNMSPSIIDCYDSNGQDYAASYMYGGRIQQQSPRCASPNYNTEANATIIVEEAEKLYSKLVKDCINKTVKELKNTNEASDSKSPSLSLLPGKELSDVQKDVS